MSATTMTQRTQATQQPLEASEAPALTWRVTVLVPAHQEQDQVAATVSSLLRQTYPVERILVVADNCTDRTEEFAHAAGADVMHTVRNSGRKAGALNQGFGAIAEELDERSLVLQMDADSELADDWLEQAVTLMDAHPHLAGISGHYFAKDITAASPVEAALVWMQRVEFARATRSRITRDVTILSGTATLFRAEALLQLRDELGVIWDPTSRVEDYRITHELRKRGWATLTAHQCQTRTDVMRTPRDWWNQRIRWQLGTLEELTERGATPHTRLDWGRQTWLYLGALIRILTILLFTLVIIPAWAIYGFTLSWPWIALTAALSVRQAWTVRDAGWRSMAIAALILPEEIYGTARHAVAARSAWLLMRHGGPSGW